MAGVEAMEVATKGEAAAVAADASGDATYGSHLPYCRANVDHVPLAFTNDQLPIYAVNAGKEKWTKRQYTLQACFRPAEPPRPADEAKDEVWDLGPHQNPCPALIFCGRGKVPKSS